jgi:hypothetical protein
MARMRNAGSGANVVGIGTSHRGASHNLARAHFRKPRPPTRLPASLQSSRGRQRREFAEDEGGFASIARLKSRGWWGVPKVFSLFEATYFAGLRKAGMPEE